MTKTVSIKDAKNRLTALARLVEHGETVVVTRNGKPVLDLVPHRQNSGLKLEAIGKFKRKYALDAIFDLVAADFDEPLAEDLLFKPLP
jgi:prevent-host-death family protein